MNNILIICIWSLCGRGNYNCFLMSMKKNKRKKGLCGRGGFLLYVQFRLTHYPIRTSYQICIAQAQLSIAIIRKHNHNRAFSHHAPDMAVNLADLSLPQLEGLKTQLDQVNESSLINFCYECILINRLYETLCS